MADRPDGEPAANATRPPLGSWALLYVVVCVLALVVMLLLYWFTQRFNLRMAG